MTHSDDTTPAPQGRPGIPGQDALPDGMLLSAYLSDELDPAVQADLEARLEADPELAGALDRTCAVVAALQGLDAVDPPEGYQDRLAARLAAERAPEVVALDARRRRAHSWTAISGIAAAAMAIAIVGAGVLTNAGRDTRQDVALDDAAPDAMAPFAAEEEDPSMMLATPEQESSALRADDRTASAPAPPEDQSAAMESGEDTSGRAASGAEAQGGGAAAAEADMAPAYGSATYQPVFLDEQAPLRDEAAARERYEELPEAESLYGTPLDEARRAASESRQAVADAEAFESGPHPADCVDHVAPGAAADDQPLVIVRVETVRYQDRPALAYVLVGASEGSATLDRTEVWVMGLPSCDTRLFLTFG